MFKRTLFTWAATACLAISTNTVAEFETELKTPEFGLAANQADQQWRFRVMLGKKEIGYHEFLVNRQEEQTLVEINAQFDVKILFINAYSYSHQNQELWLNDCLSRLESVTDDNGQMLSVLGEIDDSSFVVNTPSDRRAENATCVRSFAYWNPTFLESTRLLNPQTGEIIDVSISSQGDEMIEVVGETIAATRYALEMEDGTISIWYGRDNGQWLALEAPVSGGRVLRYELVELPISAVLVDKLTKI